jgi:putative tryptophan/tyrosine transport system substrate-binding protein
VIDRRSIVAGILSLPFTSGLAGAQALRKSWRIGVLNAGPKDAMAAFDRVLEDGLRRAGYAVGTDVSLHYRYPEWTGEDLPALAAELVSLNVDVIVAMSNPAITAAKQATTRLPIVMGLGADPVGAGFVESLARPGGNVTGLTADPTLEIIAKELQFLKEATPTLSRVAVLWNATVPTYAHFFKALVKRTSEPGSR